MPSNDLISRSAAIAAATECLFKPIGAYGFPTEKQIKDAIDALPADRRWEELRAALEHIASPLTYLNDLKNQKGSDFKMEWGYAIKLAESPSFLKQIARDALSQLDRLAPPADGAEDNKDEQ